MRITTIATLLLVLPLLGCTANPSESPTGHPSPQASTVTPVKPPSSVPDELARYEFDGTFSTSTHSTKAAKAGTEYALKAACAGSNKATFTVSHAGTTTIASITIPCDGAPHLDGVGTSLPGPPVQVNMDIQGVSSAWAILAPADALG
ncbi:hypothetical protein [Krasilnikovia sp. MM14-A1259]|uniref:hypothetical protein n=1 Tax=Krasilnikovia sp. MM14-A1259 TaxID=3373539 RepID=UPI00382B79BB